MMNGDPKPAVHCFAAWMYGEGRILKNRIYYVTLEEADEMRRNGYTIVGADQQDLFDLARWEREQYAQSRRTT